MNKNVNAAAAAASFLACILAANYVTTEFGMIRVLPGIVATAGTYFAGATFVLRDVIHDRWGRLPVFGLIAGGAVLSFLIAGPFIALASGIAFLLSETADLLVYSPLRKRGWMRAAIASNVVGSLVDSVAFLLVAAFPLWASLPGQMIGKITITLLVVVAVAIVRSRRTVIA